MKRKTFSLGTLSLMFSFFYSCSSHQPVGKPDLAEARKAIEISNSIYFQAFVKGDSSLFINRYAKDCCIMPPNSPGLCGENAARNFYRVAYYEMGLRDGKFYTTEVYGDGLEFVTEVGSFQLFDAGNAIMDEGKYLVLWRKTPDGWKMFRDSFSSNLKDNNEDQK